MWLIIMISASEGKVKVRCIIGRPVSLMSYFAGGCFLMAIAQKKSVKGRVALTQAAES